MPQGEDVDLLEGRKRPVRRGIALPPLGWIVGAGGALFLAGVLLILVNGPVDSSSSATSPVPTTGLLLMALGLFLLIMVPAVLQALAHPWAAPFTQTTGERFKHPRRIGLAVAWLGMLVAGWLSVVILTQVSYPPLPVTYAIFLVGFGPMVAVMLFDRRR